MILKWSINTLFSNNPIRFGEETTNFQTRFTQRAKIFLVPYISLSKSKETARSLPPIVVQFFLWRCTLSSLYRQVYYKCITSGDICEWNGRSWLEKNENWRVTAGWIVGEFSAGRRWRTFGIECVPAGNNFGGGDSEIAGAYRYEWPASIKSNCILRPFDDANQFS